MSILQTLRFIHAHPLAGRHKLRAWKRFLFWQVSQTIHPHPVKYPFIQGASLWVSKGMTGATGNIYTGLHEFTDMGFLLHFLQPGDLFADIGANVGSYTVLAGGVIGATCVSFEPVPSTFVTLKKNIEINKLSNRVTALNIGLGATKGSVLFTKSFDTVNHVIAQSNNESTDGAIEVAIETLDDVLTDKGIPALIKIDVEGFEQEVLNGAVGTLGNPQLKAIIIELNGSGERYGFDEKQIHSQLMGYGFSPFHYDPFTRKLLPVATFGNVNTIYLRDIDFIKNRVLSAAPIRIFSENI